MKRTASEDQPNRRWWFAPILAGATPGDRALACLGAVVGIGVIGVLAVLAGRETSGEVWMLAPVGASAVLVFAVPASPLAQPWPVIGGCAISATIGLGLGHLIEYDPLAAGLAVGLSIAIMTLTRSLHPPGGAAALTAVFAIPAGADSGPAFPLLAITLDACALVVLGWAFHHLVTHHSYPHRPPAVVPAVSDPLLPATTGRGFDPEDVDAVLARIGDSFDISREDLESILAAVEAEAATKVITRSV